jgi:KDO2-lipid IV(A) lauroyltransferase
MVRRNLKNSFPERSKTELRKIERAFYKNLADYSVEMVKSLTITPEELKSRMKVNNLELVEKYHRQGKSVIGLASHQFNWEWVLMAGSLVLPLQVDFVYQPVSNQFFENFSLKCRTRFGAYPITRGDVARETFKRRNTQRLISIVADQYPGHSKDKKYLTNFLNQETAFFDGTNQLAVMVQFPITFWRVEKMRRGFYEITIQNVAEPPYAKGETSPVEKYARELEKMILKHPANWLWSHNRWKKRHLQSQDEG